MKTSVDGKPKQPAIRIIIIILTGIFICLGFWLRLHFAVVDQCYWRGPNSYIDIAENIVAKEGFVDRKSNFGIPDRTRRPPLTPGILAGFMALSDKEGGMAAFLVFQGLLGALTALLIAIWGWRVAYSFGVYWFLLPIYTFWAPALGFAPCIMTEVTFIFLFTGAAILLLEAFRSSDWKLFVVSGIVLGLASLNRPVLYPLYFFLAVAWPWLFSKPSKTNPKRKALLALAFFISLLVVIFPWIQRNTNINERFTLITSNIGLNLLIQNTDKERPQMWDKLASMSEKGQELSGLDEVTRDGLLFGKALDAIREKPLEMVKRFIDRAIHIYNNSNDNFPDLKYHFQWTNLWSFFLLGGFVILFGSRFSDGLFLLLIQLNFIVIYGLTFFEARFRETVIPCHLVVAGVAGLYLIRKIREYRKKQRLMARGA